MSIIREIWGRIVAAGSILVPIQEGVQVQQSLEGATTYVASLTLADEAMPLDTDVEVSAFHVNLASDTGSGYVMTQVFEGVTNQIQGVSDPNKVVINCVGPLSKLRRTRTADYDLSGKTDQQAVMLALDYCGIPYVSGNIHGHGYVLGQVQPVIWKKGQSAADLIGELDRVFACATMENGAGDVTRVRYSKVPSDYDSSAVRKTFIRGQANATFYDNERQRGDLDAIQNYWRVTGLSYQGAKGSSTEGCNYQIYAEGIDAHAKFGAGVYVGPQEFSSDMIQSEGLAKEIAIRLMRWNNREPDTIRIECGDDPALMPGMCIQVTDKVYGINLASKRYLITDINRAGDFMTIDAIGGAAGSTGTLTSGISECCGTQQQDGTCTETGTNGAPDAGGGPDVPFSPTPDHCDPLSDPTCIPGVDYPTPPAPNVDDPFINCTKPGNEMSIVNSQWREGGDIGWTYGGDGVAQDVFTLTGGSLTYNQTSGEKSTADDFVFSGSSTVCLSGDVKFCDAGGSDVVLLIHLYPESGIGVGQSIALHAADFMSGYPTTAPWGLQANTEDQSGQFDPRAGMHTCAVDLVASSTNGGLSGSGSGYGSWSSFSVCFEPGALPQRVYYGGDWGSGYMEDIMCPKHPGFPDPPFSPCTHSGHKLLISLGAFFGGTPTTIDCPLVALRNLSLGMGTCERNPDWVDLSTVPPDLG